VGDQLPLRFFSSAFGREQECAYHEVEPRHEEDHVAEGEPVLLEALLGFLYESASEAVQLGVFPELLTSDEGVGLGQEEPPQDEESGRTGAKPEQRPPAMRRVVRERPREHRRQEVAERVPLLQHPAQDTPRFRRRVFERGRRAVAVDPAHRDAEEGADYQEALVAAGRGSARGRVEGEGRQLRTWS